VLFLHLVGCLYYCINDVLSHKHQIYNLTVHTDPLLDTFSMNRDCKRKSFSFPWWMFSLPLSGVPGEMLLGGRETSNKYSAMGEQVDRFTTPANKQS